MNYTEGDAAPRYRQVADCLRREVLAGAYPPGRRLPSEPDLARRFAISRGTLRQALTTLAREGLVRTVAGRGSFVAPCATAADTAGTERLVGMLIPAVARTRTPEMIAGAEAALRAAGYTLLLGSSGDDRQQEAEQVQRFLRQGISGILVYPIDGPPNAELFHQLRAQAIPLVLLDRYLPGVQADAVVADNLGGACLAVQHLVEAGRERVGFVSTDNLATSSIAERRAGYRWALEQYGRRTDDGIECLQLRRLFQWPAHDSAEAHHNQEVLRRFLARPSRPDAVFAVNDVVAYQVLQAAEHVGLRIPGDLAVVGFDNLAYPDYAGVPLTSVEQPREAIGARAAAVLLGRIAADRGGPAERVVLGTRLIVRRSSGAPAFLDAPAPAVAAAGPSR